MKISLTVLALGIPLFGQTPLAPRTASPPSPNDLKYPPLRPIQIPQAEIFTLPNGIKLYLLVDLELPVVTGTALLRTGSRFVYPENAGLAPMDGYVTCPAGIDKKTAQHLDI